MDDDRRPDFKIYESGSPIPDDLVAKVLEITVDEGIGGSALATIRFHDEQSVVSGGAKFKVGKEVKIDLGYVGKTKQVFIGEVTGWKGAFPRRGAQTLTVVAQDKMHRLRRNRRQETFLEMKDSEIVEKVLKKAGLTTATIDATPIKQDSVIQLNQTDADFVLERASLFGYEVLLDDQQKVSFRKPKLGDAPKATLVWHKELRHFTTALSLAAQQKEAQAVAWDMKSKANVTGTAKKGKERDLMGGTKTGADIVAAVDSAEPTAFTTTPASNKAEIDAYAEAAFQKRSEKFVQGEGTAVGNPDIRRGTTVKVEGIGQYLEGPYYVQRAIHTFLLDTGYTTAFQVIRTAVAAPAAPPPDYERPAPSTEEQTPVEPEIELSFEVQDPEGAPAEVPVILHSPDGKREEVKLSSDGKLDIEFES